MSEPAFTPEQEARLRELIREEQRAKLEWLETVARILADGLRAELRQRDVRAGFSSGRQPDAGPR